MTATALHEIEVALPRRKWLRYPTYEATGIPWLGSVPDHWKIDRLRWSIESARNGVWGSEPDGDNDIPCVRVTDFDRVAFRVGDNIPTQRSVTTSERRGRVLNKGDLLLEKSGGGELQPVGAVAIFDSTLPAICSNFLARLVPASNCDSRYLSYLHAHLYSARVNIRSIKQTTGIQNLDAYSYFCERVPFPPLDEQQTIAAFLDRETAHNDRLIAAKERLIGLLQEKRAALVERAVSTVSTQLVKLRRALVQRPKNGISPPAGNEGEGVPTFSIAAVRDGNIDILGNLKSASISLTEANPYLVRRGDIFIVRGNANQSLVGTCGMVSEHPENCVYPDLLIRIVPCPHVNPRYLVLILNSGIVRSQIESIARTSNGTLKISGEDVCALQVPIPEPSVQSVILRSVDCESEKLVSLSNAVKRHISLLQTLRANLITAAVTGQIDVRNYQKEAACP
jgi:type I restriction enzyme, S subunit